MGKWYSIIKLCSNENVIVDINDILEPQHINKML